jgi:hypothetical protein
MWLRWAPPQLADWRCGVRQTLENGMTCVRREKVAFPYFSVEVDHWSRNRILLFSVACNGE